MTTTTNESVVREIYAAFARGDMATLTRLFASDLVYHIPGKNLISGDYRGHEEVFGLYGRVAELTGGSFSIDLHAVMGDADHAVALTRQSGTRAGKKLDGVPEIHVFHISNGQVTEMWQAFPDQGTVDQFWS